MNISELVEIFLIGLLGSMHCIGMCGGFVAMYTLRKPAPRPALPYHLFYNIGRITTYATIGGVLGYIGSFAMTLGKHRGIPGAVLLVSGAFMILMGLDLAGIGGKRGLFEYTGITAMTFFRRSLHRVLALESAGGTFLLGLLLGLLPCGLLYPLFMHAAGSGGFINGMLSLLVFGLGTVPAMLSFGYLVSRIQAHMKLLLYRIAAFLIVLLGVRSLLRGMAFNGWISFGTYW
jgi:sulfite exporter TauE/SafE